MLVEMAIMLFKKKDYLLKTILELEVITESDTRGREDGRLSTHGRPHTSSHESIPRQFYTAAFLPTAIEIE